MKQKMVVIGGPTASGKSDVALHLAERFPLEIVNFDSMQVYRHMDIGTAKPSQEERSRYPHHLFDIRNPDEHFTAAEFIEEARRSVRDIYHRGNTPLFTGGTGLYIRSYLLGLDTIPSSPPLRELLNTRADSEGLGSLYDELKREDPLYAKNVSLNDRIRIVRALEAITITGAPISSQRKKWDGGGEMDHVLFLVLCPERPLLYQRIDRRIEGMFSAGFVEEVGNLLRMGYSPNLKSMRALGYRHTVGYLLGGESLERSKELMKRDTRRYAKRQITWFRREKASWVAPERTEKISKLVKSFLI